MQWLVLTLRRALPDLFQIAFELFSLVRDDTSIQSTDIQTLVAPFFDAAEGSGFVG